MLGIAAVAVPMGFLFGSGCADQPTVVELFTSEGCSSSPAADVLLNELAGRPDVLALSFHVDCWDDLGWADPFATAWATRRHRDYNDALGRSSVYTPQMVIDGSAEVFGGNARLVGQAVAAARAARGQARRNPLGIGLRERSGGLDITVPAGHRRRETRILAVRYDLRRGVLVKAGENRGRRLSHSHVVREMIDLGAWTGDACRLRALPAPAGQGIAVLVQELDGAGRPAAILGAARQERGLLGVSADPREAVARMVRTIRANRDGGATPL
ncbi:DUF1223 domain-containing protein [Skermanella sp. TT6]|uniref:DUF1223 domain-containing protein n=1 Tax=Skermanella cutis TaxID=2775420 RepID=A0ABX7B8X8_9PROT|nr:DUF1223 domain-containing protein [Skermanella sp. TT6]QQP90060.1 DUF1223 domain-containing protein [Skermanella sp. TT6]